MDAVLRSAEEFSVFDENSISCSHWKRRGEIAKAISVKPGVNTAKAVSLETDENSISCFHCFG
jgi:hypothetical protein